MNVRLFLPLLASLFVAPAASAEQGALGATSKGEIVITVSVAARVALSKIDAATSSGNGQTACLWLGTATRGYAVTALDAPVVWRSSARSSGGRTIPPATTLSGLSSSATHPDCGRDPSLFVGYEGATARRATLLIVPE